MQLVKYCNDKDVSLSIIGLFSKMREVELYDFMPFSQLNEMANFGDWISESPPNLKGV